MLKDKMLEAVLRSNTPPTPEQTEQFLSFLSEKYRADIDFIWEDNHSNAVGFQLTVGSDSYQWNEQGHFHQLKEVLSNLSIHQDEIVPLLRDTVTSWTPRVIAHEIGTVLSVGDGIATLAGLENAFYGEIVLFESGIRGMVQELRENNVGCVLFGNEQEVSAGSKVHRTGKPAGVGVGLEYIGRVIDALGAPIDGKGEIQAEAYRPLEHSAPGIMDREPVNRPLETGIIAIDAMFPIGRGQRELIIGDRQTGKTAIAMDAILNQKGKNTICIYVAIGQKNSSVAQLTQQLKDRGAMNYTIIVSASASDSAPLQYIAPYTGCAMGEFFMEQGKDVLIIYDDLSKHAIAYRALSLLLERSPGREAYPGDVFYLHSRLLERSAQLSAEKGGGSMTALPIVETQAGDISAYIPTNIISITDGQIFLESDLFFAGQRPAVNVGLSVSRVGGAAQTKAMKKATGALRLELAQYREMEVFNQFSGDLDEASQQQLIYGEALMQLLKQDRFQPYLQYQQVILLTVCMAHLLPKTRNISSVLQELLKHFSDSHLALCEKIELSGTLSEDEKSEILRIAKEYFQGR